MQFSGFSTFPLPQLWQVASTVSSTCCLSWRVARRLQIHNGSLKVLQASDTQMLFLWWILFMVDFVSVPVIFGYRLLTIQMFLMSGLADVLSAQIEQPRQSVEMM